MSQYPIVSVYLAYLFKAVSCSFGRVFLSILPVQNGLGFSWLPFLLVFLFTLTNISCSTAVDNNWEDHRKSVVLVRTPGSVGTAFAINRDGYYLTNYHVVEPGKLGDITIVQTLVPKKIIHRASIYWFDSERDLAVLFAPGWLNPPLIFSGREHIKVNTDVLSIGFPNSNNALAGKDNPAYTVPTLKEGIISESFELPIESGSGSLGIYAHSATVNSGNSGGPLVDECGRVVGINSSKALTSFNLSKAIRDINGSHGLTDTNISIDEGAYFAIKASELIQILRDQKIAIVSTPLVCLGEALKPDYFFASIAVLVVLVISGLMTIGYYLKNSLNAQFRQLNRDMSNNKLTGSEEFSDSDQESNYENGWDITTESGVFPSRTLECVKGDGSTIELTPGQSVTIGRDTGQCQIVSFVEEVSRLHVRLTMDSLGEIRVIDLDSTFGTYINGRRVLGNSQGDVLGEVLRDEQELVLGSGQLVYKLLPT